MELQKETVSQVVISLRTKAQASPAFSAMCRWFAERERTRQQITMANLVIAMAKEGKTFSKDEYIDALKFMADLGLGHLEVRKGKVKALINIKTTLQSIGQAAIAQRDRLDPFRPKTIFTKLPPIVEKPQTKVEMPQKETSTFSFTLEGETYSFELPKSVSSKDLLGIVSNIYGKKHGGN